MLTLPEAVQRGEMTNVSLALEAQDQLHDAVADARDQHYSWDQIADRLNTTESTARRRYSAYSKWRTTQPQT